MRRRFGTGRRGVWEDRGRDRDDFGVGVRRGGWRGGRFCRHSRKWLSGRFVGE
nr:hypothetical protein [Catenulispora pinistramenti]